MTIERWTARGEGHGWSCALHKCDVRIAGPELLVGKAQTSTGDSAVSDAPDELVQGGHSYYFIVTGGPNGCRWRDLEVFLTPPPTNEDH